MLSSILIFHPSLEFIFVDILHLFVYHEIAITEREGSPVLSSAFILTCYLPLVAKSPCSPTERRVSRSTQSCGSFSIPPFTTSKENLPVLNTRIICPGMIARTLNYNLGGSKVFHYLLKGSNAVNGLVSSPAGGR